MSNSRLDVQIQSRVEAFTTELSSLVRQAAIEAVRAALSGDGNDALASMPRQAKRPVGRPRKTEAATRSQKKRTRRNAADLEALSAQIFTYLKKNKGQGIESIATGMGIPSAEIRKPILDLITAGRLRKKGAKRGMKYFAKGR